VKKIPLLITIGVTLLLIGGYFIYEKIALRKPLDSWDLVPATAVLVYEKDNCSSCIKSVSESSIWQTLSLTFDNVKNADTLKSFLTKSIFEENELLVSVHVVRKDDYDFVFYIPGNKDPLAALSVATSQSKLIRYATREFNSVPINEVMFSHQVFSFAKLENVWVGSFTPFLVEDVIRTFKSGKTNFKKELSKFQQLSHVTGDAGNLYVNVENFYNLLTVFSTDVPVLTRAFGRFSILDIKADDKTVFLNGFSVDSANKSDHVLSIFKHQSPVPFDLKNLISNRTIVLNSYGISDGASFFADRNLFVKSAGSHQTDSISELSRSLKIDIQSLYQSIHDELGVCFLESQKGTGFSKVLVLRTDQSSRWLSAFDKIAQKFSIDTIFYEQYADYEIREVPVSNFPEKLFWPLVTGFNHCFYTTVGNAILMSDNLDELKRFLTDIDNDDTWGKSVVHNQFLKTTLLESNISLYINTSKVWRLLDPVLQQRWKQLAKDNQRFLNSLGLGAIQFSHLNNNYYTSVSWKFKPLGKDQGNGNKNPQRFTTNFTSGILRLHAVKSHVSKSDEILLQDSLNDLSLVTDEGKVLWKLPIGDAIASEVHQIDFFANGKLQYLFATRDALHIVDRLGNYVEPYPLQLPGIEVEHVSIVDYDHSKKYRFLIADKKGKLWMYDKEGKNLEGWAPKDVGESLPFPPEHHRIKGKDYIIAIRRDGLVYLMTRRGEDLKHFPMNLEAKVAGDYYLDQGSTVVDTYFVVVSRDGYRIKFNPEGKIQSREALVKLSANTQFRMVTERSNKSYLIIQQDSKKVNILDESLKNIISNDAIGPNPVKISYADFGAGRIYISITDLTQDLTYIYDEQGTLLTTPPLESSLIEIRPGDSERGIVFFSFGKTLTIEPL
jgi:hypothetical protein